MTTDEKLREIVKGAIGRCFDCAAEGEAIMCEEDKLFDRCKAIDQAITAIKSVMLEESSGKELYMDLCGRLIARILEFNPDEHDIELNLCGIIAKAQEIRDRIKGEK